VLYSKLSCLPQCSLVLLRPKVKVLVMTYKAQQKHTTTPLSDPTFFTTSTVMASQACLYFRAIAMAVPSPWASLQGDTRWVLSPSATVQMSPPQWVHPDHPTISTFLTFLPCNIFLTAHVLHLIYWNLLFVSLNCFLWFLAWKFRFYEAGILVCFFFLLSLSC
jgi:hypothetical protein